MLFSVFSHQHILFLVQYSVKKLVSISYLARVFRGCLRRGSHSFAGGRLSLGRTLVLLMVECSYLVDLFVILLSSFFPTFLFLLLRDLTRKHDIQNNNTCKVQRSGVVNIFTIKNIAVRDSEFILNFLSLARISSRP